MAKSDKQDLYNTSMGKVKQAETEYSAMGDKVGGRSDTTWDRATKDYDESRAGFSDYAQGGGLKQSDIDRMRGAYGAIGGAGGGVSAPQLGASNYRNLSSAYANAYRPDYSEADTGFRKLAGEGGGFDADQLKQLYGNVGQLTDIGKTGGITDEDKSNINRQSILDQEKTGGYSEQDRALIRAKSAASSPAYFGALKDNLERQRSATGNLANAGAVDFKLARQSAQQQGQDRMAAEQGLQDQIRQGKQQAGQFLSGQNMDLAGLRTANQLQGARSAGDLGLNTQMGITANQATGLKGLQESQTGLGQWGLGQAGGLDQFGLNQAGGLDQWDMNKAQMDMQAQSANASAGRAGAAANADFEKWLTEYGNEQKQYGLNNLKDYYGTNLDASYNYSKMGQDLLNNKYDTQGMMLGHATTNRGNTAMENAQGIAGMVGAGVGAATGLSGLGGAATVGKKALTAAQLAANRSPLK